MRPILADYDVYLPGSGLQLVTAVIPTNTGVHAIKLPLTNGGSKTHVTKATGWPPGVVFNCPRLGFPLRVNPDTRPTLLTI